MRKFYTVAILLFIICFAKEARALDISATCTFRETNPSGLVLVTREKVRYELPLTAYRADSNHQIIGSVYHFNRRFSKSRLRSVALNAFRFVPNSTSTPADVTISLTGHLGKQRLQIDRATARAIVSTATLPAHVELSSLRKIKGIYIYNLNCSVTIQ
jgi:hypothetical protein